MRLTPSLRHLTAWIACFAILLAALAPSVSHALAATKGSSNLWMEICTTSAKPTGTADGKDSTIPSPATHFEHCPFCLHHADTAGPPPSATFAIQVVRNVPHFPALFYQSPRPLFLWSAAQSRAPPAAT
ncbi:DUF2946 domain-containing protein [Actimicrobium antarcticum]|uniref:DUF2946 domain-containing protein n=1 Tax=Actimicrobium antarcticum TaxID=1051899 RepID=A0ABP7SL67_9BURK